MNQGNNPSKFNLLHYFNLDAELESPDAVHVEITKGVVFQGTNLWILIFAIVIASVGLNMNSTAVIIGAMLISPLMGPINGMGYSIATFDFSLFRKSVRNFLFAVVSSLIASTAYFAMSPVSTAHSELLARTSPTIYDVIIALFGGLAGIVAISSKNKGNVLPGVAIATALMPPLCTAGYGLATGQFEFFFGAFYLFTINTIFIAIASVWISQILKFPIRSDIAEARKKQINQIITVVITVVLLPSIYFGYQLVKQEKFNRYASQFISNVSVVEGNYLLKSKIEAKANKITLVYAGDLLSSEQQSSIRIKSLDFGLDSSCVHIEQGFSFNNGKEKNVELTLLKEEISRLHTQLKNLKVAEEIGLAEQKMSGILLNEIHALYPQVQACSYSNTIIYRDTINSLNNASAIVYLSIGNSKLKESEREKIQEWVKLRLQVESVQVIFGEG